MLKILFFNTDHFVLYCLCAQLLGRVQLFTTLWTATHQAPLSMRFPRQEYWSGLPLPSPGALPNPEIELVFCLAGGFFITEPPGKPPNYWTCQGISINTF